MDILAPEQKKEREQTECPTVSTGAASCSEGRLKSEARRALPGGLGRWREAWDPWEPPRTSSQVTEGGASHPDLQTEAPDGPGTTPPTDSGLPGLPILLSPLAGPLPHGMSSTSRDEPHFSSPGAVGGGAGGPGALGWQRPSTVSSLTPGLGGACWPERQSIPDHMPAN